MPVSSIPLTLLTAIIVIIGTTSHGRGSEPAPRAQLFEGAIPLDCVSSGAGCGESLCGEAGGGSSHVFQLCDDRALMTGDWHGLRTELQQDGVAFRGTVTQFGFGVAGGVDQPLGLGIFAPGDTFAYTGRGEYDFIMSLDSFGGPPKGKLLVGLQHWWGQYGNVTSNTGAFSPPTFAATLPAAADAAGSLLLTDFVFTQPLSESLVIFGGKKNVVGTGDQDIFAGGDGTDQFINQALVANPAFLLGLPYSSWTAGVVLPKEWGMFSAFVWDPQDRTEDGLGMEDLFGNGVIVGASARVNTEMFGMPAEHHVGGFWKNNDQLDLSVGPPGDPGYPELDPVSGFPSKRGAYSIWYGFDQYVQTFPGERRGIQPNKPPRGWGLFGRASISDENPTPLKYFLSLGIGGDTRAGNDRGDAFGLGWYYVGAGKEFGPLFEAALRPRDGTGVECYYKFQLTPWLAVTPDLQYVHPGLTNLTQNNDAFIYGLRVNMNL